MLKTKIKLLTGLLIYFSLFTFLRANYLYTTILDDAYIFFRYAENIANGFGFVWNIGEKPVEGYTSFFYLTILIAAKLLSFDLELFALIFGIVTSAVTLYLAFLIYDYLNSKKLTNCSANIFTVIILALSPAYAYWSAAGMETSFYSMFLMLTIYSFLKMSDNKDIDGRNKNHSSLILFNGILYGLLCILRFEAIPFFLAALYYLIKESNSFYKIKIGKKAMLFVLGFTITFGTYFIWRWSYFGFFFPNTFYAKTGGGLQQIAGGLLYIFKSLRLFYGLAWIPLILIFLFFKKEMLTDKVMLLLSIGIVSLVTTILIGGDHFHLGRFVIPVLPLLFVIFPLVLDKMLSSPIKYLKLNPVNRAIVLLLIISAIMIVKPVYQETFSGIKNLMDGKKEILVVYDQSAETDIIEWQNGFNIMGTTLNEIASKDDYIAAVPIGAIGYYSKINVIDMVGLVDPVIAHEEFSPTAVRKWTPGHTKGDGKYILSRKPEYIQLTDYLTRNPLETPHERSTQFVSVKEIWESEEFHRNYEFYPVEVIDGWYYNLFKRKSLK